MAPGANRGSLLQELTRINHWWTDSDWARTDPQLLAARRAPYDYRPTVLADIAPPNLYSLRGPRRVGKSTVLKQTIARLHRDGVDARRICYFAADSIESQRDIINVFQTARSLFPDLGDAPRYFLIDEVTSVKDWQRGVKWLRDNTLVAGDCLVVTGSSASDVAEGTVHLAGRRGEAVGLDRLLLPMSFPEFTKCAGYPLSDSARVPFAAFYTDEGRRVCQDALVYLATLNDALDAYFLVGGFPQAVASFRQTAEVSAGFARDLWDVVRSDLYRQGVSRPEHCLRLLEGVSSRITSTTSLPNLGTELDIDRRTVGTWLDALASSYLLLMLFKESAGAPEVGKLRKVYPVDPIIARLASLYSSGIPEPNPSQLAEAVLAMAIFRSVEGGSIDRFGRPERLFYYRSASNTEVDFLVLPERRAAESKYIDTPDRRELRAMQDNFGEGLLLTHSAVDLQVKGTILPTSVFAWLLDQGG
ncbi:MAG: ATP-binding protein [Chloroflexi bacterium]|nr:ATP-binding protein [Chloroflexota bacterium]